MAAAKKGTGPVKMKSFEGKGKMYPDIKVKGGGNKVSAMKKHLSGGMK